MTAEIRIGTQGWNYADWIGPFYPEGTRPVDFLQVYGRAFDTVEIDSTFYAIPSARIVRGWVDRTPGNFVFALKLPQEITHEKRLLDSESTTALFFDRARELGHKLGPVLVQLGPDFGPEELPALVRFLPLVPNDLMVAIEFRQRGWINDGVLALLADHGIALALSDGRWMSRKTVLALAARPTAPFLYVRWMGPDRSIVDYSRVQFDRTREMEAWAAVLLPIARRGTNVFAYINNHFAGHSPASARELQRMLGQEPIDPELLGEQMSLF
ncbi:MAG: DUF72 domain-containing protein [Gemmatimonadaceae bacterium]